MSQEILVGPERRRRWSDAEKIAIVVEAAEPGVTVTEVARRWSLRIPVSDIPLLSFLHGPSIFLPYAGAGLGRRSASR